MMFDIDTKYKKLLKLQEGILALQGQSSKQTRQYIEVGEWALALDDIAFAYVKNNAPMPVDLFALLETLAADMELESDPEYSAVAELRQRGPNPTS